MFTFPKKDLFTLVFYGFLSFWDMIFGRKKTIVSHVWNSITHFSSCVKVCTKCRNSCTKCKKIFSCTDTVLLFRKLCIPNFFSKMIQSQSSWEDNDLMLNQKCILILVFKKEWWSILFLPIKMCITFGKFIGSCLSDDIFLVKINFWSTAICFLVEIKFYHLGQGITSDWLHRLFHLRLSKTWFKNKSSRYKYALKMYIYTVSFY